MIQLMSRPGNFSCAAAGRGAMHAAAPTPNAAPPAFSRNSRRSIRSLFAILMLPLMSRALALASCSIRPGQPTPEPFFEGPSIQEMCQRHVLRHEPGGVNQNALVVALAAFLGSGNELVNLAVKLRARELALLDHAFELALEHVEFPAVDHDLVDLRPAGGIELAPRQRDEGRTRLEPGLAADHVVRGGATHRDVGAAHHLLDRVLGNHRNAERMRPFLREGRARLRPTRGAADFLEL